MCFKLNLRKELFLAVLTLKHLLHMDKHVLVEGLSVDKQLAAVVAEHTGVQQVVVLQLKMLFDLGEFLEILTAAVAAE